MGIVESVMRLAARTTGMATDEVHGQLRQSVCAACVKLVLRGKLHKLKLSHRHVRYFTNPMARDAYALHIQQQQAERIKRGLAEPGYGFKAQWENDEAIVPAGLVVQVCPPFNPQYAGHTGAVNVFGGNQRGRMVPEHLVLERMRAAA